VTGPAATAACLAGALTLGGIGALASRNAELIRKWRTWAISGPLVAGCLWLGAAGAAVLAAGLGVVAAAEYARLAKLRRADRVLVAAAAVVLPLAAWRTPGELGRVLAGALLAVALVPVFGGDVAAGAQRAAAGVFGVGWLAALSGLVLLHATALPLIFAVSVADVGAWCAGRLGRGPALSPLSPAKRWTGVLGGALAGTAALAIAAAMSGTRGLFTPAVLWCPRGSLAPERCCHLGALAVRGAPRSPSASAHQSACPRGRNRRWRQRPGPSRLLTVMA
jgi:phosphatidate cytidylyltransferase